MGRPPSYVARRLVGWAATNWPEFDGLCAQRAVDPLALPFDRLLNLIYATLIEHATDKQRHEIDRKLHTPPRGARRAPPPWQAAEDGQQFLAALATLGTFGHGVSRA